MVICRRCMCVKPHCWCTLYSDWNKPSVITLQDIKACSHCRNNVVSSRTRNRYGPLTLPTTHIHTPVNTITLITERSCRSEIKRENKWKRAEVYLYFDNGQRTCWLRSSAINGPWPRMRLDRCRHADRSKRCLVKEAAMAEEHARYQTLTRQTRVGGRVSLGIPGSHAPSLGLFFLSPFPLPHFPLFASR